MKNLIKNGFCLLGLFFAIVIYAQSKVQTVVVIQDNAPLMGKYGEILCPNGTVFTVTETDGKTFVVKGILFGKEVSGRINAEFIEEKKSEKDEKKNDEEELKPENLKPEKNKTDVKKEEVKDEFEVPSVKYLSKELSPEFVKFFYKEIRDQLQCKNLITKELTPSSSPISIASADDCSKLNDGDVVMLDGNPYSLSNDFATIMIYNTNFTEKEFPVLLKRLPDQDNNFRKMKGKLLCVYSPNTEIPKWRSNEGIKNIFRQIDKDELGIRIEDFVRQLQDGKQFQLKCPKCEGKGERRESPKAKLSKCVFCKGSGLSSVQDSYSAVEKDFKKQQKK